MNLSLLFSSLSLFSALILSACGNGLDGGLYTIGGNVSGLRGSLTLLNNSVEFIEITNVGFFSFPNLKEEGESFSISIQSQPAGQSCSISSGEGIIDKNNYTQVEIQCVDMIHRNSHKTFPLSGLNEE